MVRFPTYTWENPRKWKQGLLDPVPGHRRLISIGLSKWFQSILNFKLVDLETFGSICVHIPIWSHLSLFENRQLWNPKRLWFITIFLMLKWQLGASHLCFTQKIRRLLIKTTMSPRQMMSMAMTRWAAGCRFGATHLHWLVVWNIFYFPMYWEWSSPLTHIFRGVGFNHQPVQRLSDAHSPRSQTMKTCLRWCPDSWAGLDPGGWLVISLSSRLEGTILAATLPLWKIWKILDHRVYQRNWSNLPN